MADAAPGRHFRKSLSLMNVPRRRWAIAIHLCLTSLHSMKLHLYWNVSQKTVWLKLHRIREAWMPQADPGMPHNAPVEVDKTYVGGKDKDMSKAKHKPLVEPGAERGTTGKTDVVRGKDPGHQAGVHQSQTRRQGDATGLCGRPHRPNTMASKGSAPRTLSPHMSGNRPTPTAWNPYWSMRKRAHTGMFFHKLSPKHLNRYVQEFSGKHNLRNSDTLDQMRTVVDRFTWRHTARDSPSSMTCVCSIHSRTPYRRTSRVDFPHRC